MKKEYEVSLEWRCKAGVPLGDWDTEKMYYVVCKHEDLLERILFYMHSDYKKCVACPNENSELVTLWREKKDKCWSDISDLA